MSLSKWRVEGECPSCGQPVEAIYYRDAENQLFEEPQPPAYWQSLDDAGGELFVGCPCGGQVTFTIPMRTTDPGPETPGSGSEPS